MNRTPVHSSHIASVGYDEKEKRLEVEFKDGSIYSYHNVDSKEHHDLMNARSIGSHLHVHIKHRHTYAKH